MPASAIPREARNARRSACFRPRESTDKREDFLAVTCFAPCKSARRLKDKTTAHTLERVIPKN